MAVLRSAETASEITEPIIGDRKLIESVPVQMSAPHSAPHRKPQQGSMNTAVVRAGIVNVPVTDRPGHVVRPTAEGYAAMRPIAEAAISERR